MTTLQQGALSTNGTPYKRGLYRRRAPDLLERVLAALLIGSILVSGLLMLAVGAGALWLLVVVVQDLARRLGG